MFCVWSGDLKSGDTSEVFGNWMLEFCILIGVVDWRVVL